MGRYATTNTGFNYKFAVGNQNSSMGKLLEDLFTGYDDVICDRFTNSEVGEIVELYIHDNVIFHEAIEEYLKDYEPISDSEWKEFSTMDKSFKQERLDKYMMTLFLDHVTGRDLEQITLRVDY